MKQFVLGFVCGVAAGAAGLLLFVLFSDSIALTIR